MKQRKTVTRKKRKPLHGKFVVWACTTGRTKHCWHFNKPELNPRCCWCGAYNRGAYNPDSDYQQQ